MMASSQKFFTSIPEELIDLHKFCQSVLPGQKILTLIGGGTATLTYLYTHDIEPEYTHIVILGDRGYWETAAHRLAQPHHILALPHRASDEFINPAEHDEQKNILPHQSQSAYVHSIDFQSRLRELEKATVEHLNRINKKIFIAKKTQAMKIEKVDSLFIIETNSNSNPIFTHKIIIATGAGPTRKLPAELLKEIDHKHFTEVNQRILDYTDVLTPSVAKICKGKNVLIYGGGATAAWAMEVASLTAKPIAWIAKSGFGDAVSAGPRVGAILEKSRLVQVHGKIDKITYKECPDSKEYKLFISVSSSKPLSSEYFFVDYLFNCIGQEPYELGGIPYLISKELQNSLGPHVDKNLLTGSESILAWSTPKGDLMIIGAAHGTFYDRDRPSLSNLPSVSQFLPRSGRVPITVSGVVASVCALTNYMPITQDLKTGKINVHSLNLNIMNATQLAVYFTACYPNASPDIVNKAVTTFISERFKTEFGLSDSEISKFLMIHFGSLQEERVVRSKL